MLSIDEAISHAREVANEQKRRSGICVQNDLECDKFSSCLKCAEEHEQIAEWLEELKELRLQNHLGRDEALIAGRKEGYNKAIDDFVKRIDGKMPCDICDGAEALFHIEELAEQLKAGVED